MQNQLREFFDKVIGLEILQWCDIFIFVFIFDNISDYVVSDEDSEVGDKKSDDIWCFISVQFDEVCLSSSLGSEVDIDDLEEFWFFFFIYSLWVQEKYSFIWRILKFLRVYLCMI